MPFFAWNPRLAVAVGLMTGLGCTAPDPGSNVGDEETRLRAKYAPIINGTLETGRQNVVALVDRQHGGLCTGTIVADRVVLTAKHCVQGADDAGPIDASALSVVVGNNAFGGGTRWFTAAEIVTTPGAYTEGTFGVQDLAGKDVAVVTLTTSPGVLPMRMKLTSPEDQIGQPAVAVGYGQTPSGGAGTKYTVDTTVARVQAETIEVDGTVCQGDSGGPLINEDDETFGVVSYGSAMACGGGASFYQRIDIYAQLILDAIKKSGDCSNDGPEACDGFDNDCDKQIDEDCAQQGEVCASDADCLSRLCADTASGKICATRCDPLAPSSGCDEGFFCSGTNGCQGLCLPGKIGEKPFGEACADDSECASLFCVDPGDGKRRCLVACRGGEGNCLSGEACVAQNGQCGSCVDAVLVGSALGEDEPCDQDTDCRSGSCFDDGGTKYCAEMCVSDDDCTPQHHCRDKACVRGPRQGLGGACEEHGDCAKDFFCAKTADGDFCTRECSAEEPCGAGFTCGAASNGKVCIPDTSVLAGPCEADKDCMSGRCDAASKTCTKLCNSPNACGAGLECVRSGEAEGLCLTPMAADTNAALAASDPDVAAPGEMAAAKSEDKGCAVSGAQVGSETGAAWLSYGLGATLALGFSRRRRRAA